MFEFLSEDVATVMGANAPVAFLLVFVATAFESFFLLGLLVPGVVIVAAAGALVGAGRLPLEEVLVAASTGSFTGTVASFALGRRLATRIRTIRPFSGYATAVGRAEAFFHRYGVLSVLFGSFVPGLKQTVPAVAGMAGMSWWRFLPIAMATAVVVTLAVMLPAVGFGMGLGGIGSADPRLIALLVVVVVLIFLAYRLARLVAGWLLPMLARMARRASGRAAARGVPGARFVDAVLANRGGVLAPVVWALAAALALVGFVRLALDLTFGSRLAAADQALSNFVHAFRSPSADAAMVAVTMVGDSVVLTALSVTLVAVLLLARDFRAAGAAALLLSAAALSVPAIKGLLQRARPTELYTGNEAFSFPSGHASLSMAVIGVVAVALAHSLPWRARIVVYGIAVATATLIAFSRVYLAAHWPSDVVAGLLFGGMVVAAFALALHNRRLGARPLLLAAALSVVFIAAYGAHLRSGYSAWRERYEATVAPLVLEHATWLQNGWRSLPARRIELGGETGEPLQFQSDAGEARLASAMSAAGWAVVPADLAAALATALPGTAPLDERRPLPLLHDGLAPALVATAASGPDRRLVLRFWPSGWVTRAGRTILVGSLSEERLDALPFGLATLKDKAAGEGAVAGVVLTIGEGDGLTVTRPEGDDGPLLVTPGSPDG